MLSDAGPLGAHHLAAGYLDQASTLRMIARHQGATEPMQIYSITSGKGGVGKTSLICNIAARFGQLGQSVLLIDADMGLANIDILMGLKPKATLAEFFEGDVELPELLLPGPRNVTVLPSASGVHELAHLSDANILKLMSALDALEQSFDVLLVDTGAGVGKNVRYFNAAAQDVLVVATPEPTSMTDAYATMKVMHAEHSVKQFRLIVNMTRDAKQARQVYRHLTTVADRFLPDISIDYLGYVARDPQVSGAIIQRKLLIEGWPNSPASLCIEQLVDALMMDAQNRPPSGNLQFFWRRLLEQGA